MENPGQDNRQGAKTFLGRTKRGRRLVFATKRGGKYLFLKKIKGLTLFSSKKRGTTRFFQSAELKYFFAKIIFQTDIED